MPRMLTGDGTAAVAEPQTHTPTSQTPLGCALISCWPAEQADPWTQVAAVSYVVGASGRAGQG